MENYKYTLRYQNDDKIAEHTFNADVSIDDLKTELMNFLRGCSWTEAQTRFLEENPEESIRSDVMSEQYDRIFEFINKAVDEEWGAERILKELRKEFL